MEQNDLSGVKVGDKLFHARYGECKVADVNIRAGIRYTIRISVGGLAYNKSFTLEGKEDVDDGLPTLFLAKPTIIYPQPKRYVEKTVQGWVGFCRVKNDGSIRPRPFLYASKDDANELVGNDSSIPKAVWVCHKYREEVKDE